MVIYALIGSYGFYICVNRPDFNSRSRHLFIFSIFAGDTADPWFHYGWKVADGILRFELGHGKLKSAWIAQGPFRKVA